MKYVSALLKSLATTGILFAMIACLNPIGVDPNFKLNLDVNAKVSGELLTDSVNSAEVQIQNHTSTVNINVVNIEQTAWSKEEVNGEKRAVKTTSVAARITGGPHIESREAVLLRPISKNPASDTNDFYELTFTYKRAAGEKADKYYNDPAHAGASQEGTKTLTIEDLPRGKYLIHVYRNTEGGIEIGVDPVDENKKDSTDFTANFNVNNYINGLDFSGMTFKVKSDTTVEFSNEFQAQFNALTAGVDAIATAINNLNRFPRGYAPVIVYNHTQYPAGLEWTMKDTAANATINERTGSLSPPIGAYDQDATLLRTENYAGKVTAGGKVSEKTIPLFGMKQAYIHIYKTSSGGVDFVVTDNASYWNLDTVKLIPNIDISYLQIKFDRDAYFVVWNDSNTVIDAYLENEYDPSTEHAAYARNISPNGNKNLLMPNGSTQIKVSELANNYKLYIVNPADRRQIVGLDRAVIPDTGAFASSVNQYHFTGFTVTLPPETISYDVTANGSSTETTTKLTFTFEKNPGTISFSNFKKDFGITGFVGTLDKKSDTVYELPVTVTKTELVKLHVEIDKVPNNQRDVQVYYKEDTEQPEFIPIKSIEMDNYSISSGSVTTVTYTIYPENATIKAPLYFFRGLFAGLNQGQNVLSITWTQPGTTFNGITAPNKGELKIMIDWNKWATATEFFTGNSVKDKVTIMAYVPKGKSQTGTTTVRNGDFSADEATLMYHVKSNGIIPAAQQTDNWFSSYVSMLSAGLGGLGHTEAGRPFSDPTKITFSKR